MGDKLQKHNPGLLPLSNLNVMDDAVMESPSPGTVSVQSFRFTDSPFVKGIKGSINFQDFVSPSKEGEISMEFSPRNLHKASCSKPTPNQPQLNNDPTSDRMFKEKVKRKRRPIRGDLFSSKEESQDKSLRVSEDSFIALNDSPAPVQPTNIATLFPSTNDTDGRPTGSPSFTDASYIGSLVTTTERKVEQGFFQPKEISSSSSFNDLGGGTSPIKTSGRTGRGLFQQIETGSPSFSDTHQQTGPFTDVIEEAAPVKSSGRTARGLFLPKEEGLSRLRPGGSSVMSLGQTEEAFSLNPADIFSSMSSPRSPDTPVLNLWGASGAAGDGAQNTSANQTDFSFRRCRSQEIRKNLFDLSNTPPNTYGRHKSMSKRSLFKRPLDIQVKEGSLCKRMREVPRPPSPDALPDTRLSLIPATSEVSAADQERIKSAVDTLQSRDLVSDGSRKYCLPVITGKHQDLMNIDHDTMADLLTGQYDSVHDRLTVIDCRYPYEYAGGHIKDAINIYTEAEISDFLSQEIEDVKNTNSVHILVFHCEFSSQRGPSLSRHLRQLDRHMNLMQYPRLLFPEVYMLHGGYKEFYTHHPILCFPVGYVPMISEAHTAAYLHFRARAKTWAHSDIKHKTTV